MSALIEFFHSALPYLITVSALMLMGLGVLIFLVLRKSRKTPKDQQDAAEGVNNKDKTGSILHLKKSFAQASELLKKKGTGKNYQYHIPWILVLGESGSGKSTLLNNNLLESSVRKKDVETGEDEPGVQWWFYDKGVAVKPKGSLSLNTGGKNAEGKGWHNVLRMLRKHRSNRPIDGVVVTIPIQDVLSMNQSQPEVHARIKEKAGVLHEKLGELQKELGVNFPVYVLFTKCDRISGFSSFAKALPEKFHRNIFGWSNPNSLDASYSSAWVQSGIRSLHQDLKKMQMEIFAEKGNVTGAEDLFLFPSRFSELEETISKYMDVLFKSTAFHRSFFFRGFFFTGSPEGESGKNPSPLFLRDLFEEKIFMEGGVAEIVDQTLISKNRYLKRIQAGFAAAAVVGTLGLTHAFFSLKEEKNLELPVLNLISGSLEEMEYKKTIDGSLFEKKALNLLNGMTKMDPSGFYSVFIPSSWVSNIRSGVMQSMSIANEKIIIKMMSIELNNRAKKMGFSSERLHEKLTEKTLQSVHFEDSTAFRQLFGFVQEFAELEKSLKIYNEQVITGKADSREFDHLVKYLYGFTLNADFSEEALTKLKGEPINTDILKANVNARIWETTRQFYDHIFTENHLAQQLFQLQERIENLSESDPSKGQFEVIVQFQEIFQLLQQIEKDLGDPALNWIAGKQLDLGTKYQQVLAGIQASEFFDESVYLELKRRSQKEFEGFQNDLKHVQTVLTGPLLASDQGQIQLRLGEKLQLFKNALDSYFSMTFARPANGKFQMIQSLPPGKQLIWNTAFLEQGVKLYENYQVFMQEKLPAFPGLFQPIFEHAARKSLESNLIGLLAKAQTLKNSSDNSNSALQQEILLSTNKNFKIASPYLGQILQILERLQMHSTNRRLFQVLAAQGNRTLKEVDRYLVDERLYLMKGDDFKWWNAVEAPSFRAYNVNGAEEMKYYLQIQRDRVAFLASEFAEPMVKLLGYRNKHRGTVNQALFTRWERILEALQAYQKKRPGNSIETLETFLLNDLDQMALKQCGGNSSNKYLHTHSGDYFLQIRNRIRRKLVTRCQEVNYQIGYQEY